ncbi:WW domain-containing protein [Aspergillus clavatus NRRL 1]|uniref:WW domain protein n=1 Tax=Aspergillus clavatus (strain ATCC 1007 / CBS 513.65 / DSM 816 / NCTC 3887 / NRRL 1 / QM 1276 / 107) TaxID=344612 RepID=A1CAA3_ASPCL|nr:WW domain protein [Aspergillus clavatus NRRL 1]EAW12671.1 WW domain protein [Aspergillus clavatus NRRL 1]
MSANPSSSPSGRPPSAEKDVTDSPSKLPVGNQQEPESRAEDVQEREQLEQNEEKEDESPSEKHNQQQREGGKKSTGDNDDNDEGEEASAPPLPDEEVPPPLPSEAPPGEDDGWEPLWDANAQAYYFYNRFTGVSQWDNPRVPAATAELPGVTPEREAPAKDKAPVVGGYNPAIHGDYDPTADYAQQYEQPADGGVLGAGLDPNASYEAVGQFNRFTGRWQDASLNPENFNDENKSRRQMNAFFDVDAAANAHDGRSLRAERSARKLTKKELKMFKEKRREKKEEKRRAWLRD